jgi:molybdopterin-guanine dinucleotide biosynthesis protein A
MLPLSFDPQEVTAAILAGGEGRRMDGRDKGLVEIGGKPLIAHVVAALRGQSGPLLICANRNSAEYAAFAEVVADAAQGYRGPLAGIATALAHCKTTWLLTVPVDAPQPPQDLSQQLWAAAARSGAEAAVAFEGVSPQPMFALYRARLAESAATALASDLPVWQWQQRIGATEVFFDDGVGLFANLNSEDELVAWERAHAEH